MIEQTIFTLLSSAPLITALASNRIYPLVLPEGSALPAIEYGVISATAAPTFQSAGSQRFRIEINCWGSDYSSAVTLRSAVIKSLSGYYDGSITVQFAMSRDLFDHDLLQYRVIAEFYVTTANF